MTLGSPAALPPGANGTHAAAPAVEPPQGPAAGDAAPPPSTVWADRLAAFRERSVPEQLAGLAAHLDLPPHALDCVDGVLAWHKGQKCWMLPSYSPEWQVVGIYTRNTDGEKGNEAGSSGQLSTPPADRWDAGGAIYIPEGWSDVLTLRALGLTAIGRHSNAAGLEPLTAFLAKHAAGRDVIVMGEYDQKPDGRWPGLAAKTLAANLAAKIGDVCRVRWCLTPDGTSKDARAWAHAQGICHATSREECLAVGQAWAAGVDAVAQMPAPPAAAGTAGAGASAAAPAAKPNFGWFTLAELLARPRGITFLIRKVLVDGQPCVTGGAFKALKTSVSLDAAVSLAAGVPFLGHFDVPEPVPVLVVSGESGEATIRDTVERVCLSRGMSPANLPLHVCFDVPQLCEPAHLEAIAEKVKATGARVLFYDPLYLGLLSGADPRAAANVYSMGPLLLGISQTCLKAGCTPVLIHHFVTSREAQGKVPELADLAFAGIKEFARQWVLLGRRERYEEGTGTHRLWLSVGGSAGHSGLWALDVEEGVPRDDLSGRTWDVAVRPGSDARREARSEREREKREEKLNKEHEEEAQAMQVLDALDPGKGGVSRRQVRDALGWDSRKFDRVVARLVLGKVVKECPVVVTAGKGAKQARPGLRRNTDDDPA